MPDIVLRSVTRIRSIPDGNGRARRVRVLDGCSAIFPEGRVSTILGPSGSGKTTLLRVVNRLEDADEGEILYQERNVREYSVTELRRRIGFVSQVPVMFEGTVEANLRAARRFDPAGRPDAEADLVRVLERAGLNGDYLGRDAARLSVGQAQRVAVARALACRPHALLMDEPTSALDPASAEAVVETVKELSEGEGLTVVMVTHTMDVARRAGHRTAVLVKGRIVQEDRTDVIFGGGASPEVARFLDGRLRE